VRVAVLGSGSRGNAVVLETKGVTLVVDVGFGARAVLKRAAAAGVPLNHAAGVILTHEHQDHSRGAAALARRLGCPVYGSRGTLAALRSTLTDLPTIPIDAERRTSILDFTVTAVGTSHDAAEPLALAIQLRTSGTKIGVAYDVGRSSPALRHLLRGCHCLIVEANHDDALLRTGPYPYAVQRRIAGAGGHLSNRASAELLRHLVHAELETVVLAHVSNACNEPELVLASVNPTLQDLGFRGRLVVAEQDAPSPAFEVTGPSGQLGLSLLA